MSSAWLRSPRLNEPEEFQEHEAQAERYDLAGALLDRFGEYAPPRPTERETCRGCAGAGTVGEFACSACGGKGYRNEFVERREEGYPRRMVGRRSPRRAGPTLPPQSALSQRPTQANRAR
jgi:hypothetical protein